MRTLIVYTATLHAVSSGLIYNPFDKRLHTSECGSVARMAASAKNPKWHFDDRQAAEICLDEHHAAGAASGGSWRPAASLTRIDEVERSRPSVPRHLLPTRRSATRSCGAVWKVLRSGLTST